MNILLTFVEGKSSKFYKLSVDGSTLTINYGRIGSDGQTQEKTFGSEAEAIKEYDALVAAKTKKGYVKQEAEASATPAVAKVEAGTPAAEEGAAVPAAKAAAAPKAPAKPKVAAPLPVAALTDPEVAGLDLELYRSGPLPVPERDSEPFETGDQTIAGYKVSFGEDDEVIITDAKGKRLKNPPDKLRKTEEYQALMRGRKDDRLREKRARRIVEERMIAGAEFSAEELAWLIEDEAFAPLLKGLIVYPDGKAERAGLLLRVDPERGAGLLPLDYDGRWAGQVPVEIAHPMKMGDTSVWQDLLIDLGLQQSLVQVFREVKTLPASQRELTESSLLGGRETRSGSVVERVLMEEGWVVRRGMARRKLSLRAADGLQTVEAWFDYGEYYMPGESTTTGAFGFNDTAGKPIKFVAVPPVLLSEAIRSLELALSQAGAKKGETDEDDEEESESGEDAEDAG